jgi:hypothetical protein
MDQRQENGEASARHHETEHEETKTKMHETELTNIRESQQANAHRMDCTIENGACLVKRIPRTIQHHGRRDVPGMRGCKENSTSLLNGVPKAREFFLRRIKG